MNLDNVVRELMLAIFAVAHAILVIAVVYVFLLFINLGSVVGTMILIYPVLSLVKNWLKSIQEL